MSIIRNIEQNHKMDSKRTCSDFWKNRKNMQSLISQGLAGQINPIFIGYLNCSALPKEENFA